MTVKKRSHGGARKGAGRKDGVSVVKVTITLTPSTLATLDHQRGEESRGAYLSRKINLDTPTKHTTIPPSPPSRGAD